MKTSYNREIRHIIANFSIKRVATGYRLGSKSETINTLQNLLKWNWVECDYIEGYYVFVKPTTKLISLFGADVSKDPVSTKSITEGYLDSMTIS